jgi:DNA repair exonuclease SbcCD ATPase subunit
MRRRGARNTSSLFAFQDVMASLIGIMFFIVILMALDIVDQYTPVAEADTANGDPIVELQAKLKELTEEQTRLEQAIASVTEKRNAADAFTDKQLLESVQEMDRELRYLSEKIKQTEAGLADIESKNKSVKEKLAASRIEIRGLDEEIAKLKARAQAKRALPRVAYIIDETTRREPWLVEVTEKSIRVATKDGKSSVTTFAADTAAGRRAKFLSWTKSKNAMKYYFVILIKPSGIEQAEKLETELKKRGFRTGKDLLPETWEPFYVND